MQFMLLAVKSPLHDPHAGQPLSSSSLSSASSMVPALKAPTPSKTLMRSTVRPSAVRPAGMGPPLTKMVGMSRRMAAMSIPGTILSQLGMQTMPSNWWAEIMVSTESAMSSRLGSENFIPPWPMAMPSSTAMVLNSKGTPPGRPDRGFDDLANSLRWTCPGTMSA